MHIRKEIGGHVANRLQTALYREVAYLIARSPKTGNVWLENLNRRLPHRGDPVRAHARHPSAVARSAWVFGAKVAPSWY
jgi:hypothetical protein